MSILELAASMFLFAGIWVVVFQRGIWRRDGVAVKRWVVALGVVGIIIGVALEIFGVATGVVQLV